MPVFAKSVPVVDQPVVPKMEIDEDGDVNLTLDGIDIAFIGNSDGNLHRYWVAPPDRLKLASKGIAFDGDYVQIAGVSR